MARVLVVDDDPFVCLAIRAWLGTGFDVVLADGGGTGLEALEHSDFDVMVVDIFMPHMNGLESIRAFHQCAPNVPIIATSGFTFRDHHGPAPDFLRMATRFGAAYCLAKPFKSGDLLHSIEQCLAIPLPASRTGPRVARRALEPADAQNVSKQAELPRRSGFRG